MKRVLAIILVAVLVIGGITAGVIAYNSNNAALQTQIEEIEPEIPAEDYNDDLPAENVGSIAGIE